jgi:hypothetical protein
MDLGINDTVTYKQLTSAQAMLDEELIFDTVINLNC